MKGLLNTLSLLFILLISYNSISQNLVQSRVANLVPGDYATSGTVYLETFDNNTIQVRFDTDYLTQSNVFDVHVYLTNNTNYTAPINVSNDYLIANIGTISGLNYSSGAMTFPISSSVSIDDYDHIVFVCISFGQLHWAHGDFTTYTIPTLADHTESCLATPAAPVLNISGAANITGVSNTPFPITTPGTTSINWTFDDGAGNYATTSQNVVVTDLNVQINQLQNTLTATQAPTGTMYQWIDCDDNNSIIPGATSPTFTALEEGNYAVIADAGLCIDTSICVPVSFDDVYDAPILSDTTDFCELTPTTPSMTLNNGTMLVGVPDVSFPITTVGTTTVTWTFTSGSGNTLTSAQDITVEVINASVMQNGNILDASPTTPNASYQWIDCDDNNAPIAGETTASFTASQEGNYAVITSIGNCSDTSACYTVSFANLDPLVNEVAVQLFPNPSNGQFTVQFGEPIEAIRISVVDLQGRIVYEESYDSALQVPVSLDAEPSTYLVRLQTSKGSKTLRYLLR